MKSFTIYLEKDIIEQLSLYIKPESDNSKWHIDERETICHDGCNVFMKTLYRCGLYGVFYTEWRLNNKLFEIHYPPFTFIVKE